MLGEQRLGVELHALHRQAAVAQPHDLAVLGFGADLEARGQSLALDDQRVVTGGHKTILQLGENPPAIMLDARNLAVHHLLRAHHLAAERLSDRLVAKAYTEDRYPAGQPLDGGERHPGLVRRTRAWREHDMRRRERLDLRYVELVVAHYAHVGAELPEVLHQVEGERIVVVDHQDHGPALRLILGYCALCVRSRPRWKVC